MMELIAFLFLVLMTAEELFVKSEEWRSGFVCLPLSLMSFPGQLGKVCLVLAVCL